MESARVNIEYSDGNLCSLNNLKLLLYNLQIRVVKLVGITDHFLVNLLDNSDLKKLFSEDATIALRASSYTAILPGQLKANRSVIVQEVERQILQHLKTKLRMKYYNRTNGPPFKVPPDYRK